MIMDRDKVLVETRKIRTRDYAEVDYLDNDVSNLRDELHSQIELERAVGALRHLIARDPLAADLKLSLFASSVFSYRWRKTANPLPPEFAATGSSLEAVEALRNMPAVRCMLTEADALKNAPPPSLRLLQWLLAGPGGVTLRALPRPQPTADQPLPDFTFQVINPTLTEKWQSQSQNKTIVTGFLGQPLDIYHRIVHLGLPVGESPMKLRRNMATAIQDSSPGYGLRCSELGTPLLCVAECQCAIVLPGASPWRSGGESHLLLYDGRLALVTRIFAFKGGVLKHALGRKGRATSSFKMPQFKFEVNRQSAPDVGATPLRMAQSGQPSLSNALTTTSPSLQRESKAEPKSKAKTKTKRECKPITGPIIRPKSDLITHSPSKPTPTLISELQPTTTIAQPAAPPASVTSDQLESDTKPQSEAELEIDSKSKKDLPKPATASEVEVEIIVHAPNDWPLQSTSSMGDLERTAESTSIDDASTEFNADISADRDGHHSGKPTLSTKITKQIDVAFNQDNTILQDVMLVLSLIWIQLQYCIKLWISGGYSGLFT